MDIIKIEPNPVQDLLRELDFLTLCRLTENEISRARIYMIRAYEFLSRSEGHKQSSRFCSPNPSALYDFYLSQLADYYLYFRDHIKDDFNLFDLVAAESLSYAIPTNFNYSKDYTVMTHCLYTHVEIAQPQEN